MSIARERDIIVPYRLSEPEAAAPESLIPPDALSEIRDWMRPFETHQDTRDLIETHEAEEAEREQVVAELEHQRCAIDELICRLESANHEGEQDAQLDDLRTQQRWLDAAISLARNGPAQLVASMAGSVSQIAGSVASSVSCIASSSMVQAGALMAEVTASAIERMSIGDMARNFTPAHFAQMSEAQLDAVAARIDRHVDKSIASSAAFAGRLEASGADISAWRARREALQDDLNSDDPMRRTRAAYLNSANDWQGAQDAGLSPEEIEERRRQMEEDRKAYALKLREQAARDARAAGLSGKEAEDYIDRREREGLAEADEQVQQMAQADREAYLATVRQQAARTAREQGLNDEDTQALIAAAEANAVSDMTDAPGRTEEYHAKFNRFLERETQEHAPEVTMSVDANTVPAAEGADRTATASTPAVRSSRFGGSAEPDDAPDEAAPSRFAVAEVDTEELAQLSPQGLGTAGKPQGRA